MNIFICGGGTGGHFFSGVAMAEKILDRNPSAKIIFIGTKNGIEGRTKLEDPRMKVLFICAKGLKGKGLGQRLLGVGYLLLGFLQSLGLLVRYRPKMIVGVGGYASAPTVFAGFLLRWLFRWKVWVLDQNSSPGLVNRIFSRLPLLAYSAFEFPRFQLVDLPLRRAFEQAAAHPQKAHWPPKKILILGGSQGARGLNEKWKEVAPEVKKLIPDLQIFHQSGLSAQKELNEFYLSQGISAMVFAFSEKLYEFYDQADLIVCRSGAMTVFEVMKFKRPAIFVPFPAAADDHQTKNALAVQNSNWVIPETEFKWAKLRQLLESQTPSIPHRISENLTNWERILVI